MNVGRELEKVIEKLDKISRGAELAYLKKDVDVSRRAWGREKTDAYIVWIHCCGDKKKFEKIKNKMKKLRGKALKEGHSIFFSLRHHTSLDEMLENEPKEFLIGEIYSDLWRGKEEERFLKILYERYRKSVVEAAFKVWEYSKELLNKFYFGGSSALVLITLSDGVEIPGKGLVRVPEELKREIIENIAYPGDFDVIYPEKEWKKLGSGPEFYHRELELRNWLYERLEIDFIPKKSVENRAYAVFGEKRLPIENPADIPSSMVGFFLQYDDREFGVSKWNRYSKIFELIRKEFG